MFEVSGKCLRYRSSMDVPFTARSSFAIVLNITTEEFMSMTNEYRVSTFTPTNQATHASILLREERKDECVDFLNGLLVANKLTRSV